MQIKNGSWKSKSANIKLKNDSQDTEQPCLWGSFTKRKDLNYKPGYSIYTKLSMTFPHLTASCQHFYQKTPKKQNTHSKTNKQAKTNQKPTNKQKPLHFWAKVREVIGNIQSQRGVISYPRRRTKQNTWNYYSSPEETLFPHFIERHWQ